MKLSQNSLNMTLSCCNKILLELPRSLVWRLITTPSARHLWQPDLLSATVLSGDPQPWRKGAILKLVFEQKNKPLVVQESVVSSRYEDNLTLLQHWPKYHLHYHFICSGHTQETTTLTLQKHLKFRHWISRIASPITPIIFNQSAMDELLAINTLSLRLHEQSHHTTT